MSHLTHFTLSSYEWALCLPTSFPISGLARHGVKLRLCRSSWRAFACTHPLMFPSTSPRETVLACPPSPSWNLPSFTVESTLSSSCSLLDLPLSCHGAVLAHLDSLPPHDLVLWTDSSVPFVLVKAALVYFPTALAVALKPLSLFQQAQFVQACLLKPAPFGMLSAGLGSTNKSAISLLFSFYLILVLSSPPCPLLHLSFHYKLFGTSDRNCLLSPPVLSGYNGSLDTCFSRGLTRLMSGPDGERYLHPCSFSLLLSLVSTLVFSWTGGIVSHRNSLTHRFLQFPLKNLCSLVKLIVFSLVYAATDTAYC